MYPWSSWRTLVPLVIGAVGLVGFVAWELYGAREPLIRLHVFFNRTTAVSYFGSFVHGTVLWALLYYLPLYFEVVKHLSPIVSLSPIPQGFSPALASG